MKEVILKFNGELGSVRLFKAFKSEDNTFTQIQELNFREKITVLKRTSKVINDEVVAGILFNRELYDFTETENTVNVTLDEQWSVLDSTDVITVNDFIPVIPIEEEVDSKIALEVYDTVCGIEFEGYNELKEKIVNTTFEKAKAEGQVDRILHNTLKLIF